MTETQTILEIVKISTALVVLGVIIFLAYMYWLTDSKLKLKLLDDKEKDIDAKIKDMSLNDVVDLNNSERTDKTKP